MAVKLSHALGAETVVFTSSAHKEADAKRLGADSIVLTSDRAAMKTHSPALDFIVDTVSVSHDLDPYLSLLRRDGTHVLVGGPEHPHPSPTVNRLIAKRRRLAGSLIGGIAETQETLDFCGEKGIVSDVEVIPMAGINNAYERMLRSDVRYRFVIDMRSLAAQQPTPR